MNKKSIKIVYTFSLVGHTLIIIFELYISIMMLFYLKNIMNNENDLSIAISIIAIIVLMGFTFWSMKQLIILLKDYKDLKNKLYIQIKGKVIGFTKSLDEETGKKINDLPVISDINTNEKIVLKIKGELIIGQVYTFNYLKNSKIGEIVK